MSIFISICSQMNIYIIINQYFKNKIKTLAEVKKKNVFLQPQN